MQPKFSLSGKTVLVTGAGRGMGRLFALRAAAEGAATVVLWDIAAVSLHDVGRAVSAYGARAVEQLVDLSELSAIHTRATMNFNALAPMYVAAEFLPAMMKGGTGQRIMNITSAAGTLANPNMSVYAASKWAVIGWSDSLRLELERHGSKVMVTTFCPSYGCGPGMAGHAGRNSRQADPVDGQIGHGAPWRTSH